MIDYTNSKQFNTWLKSKDCRGNRLVLDKEKQAILKRFEETKDTVKIVEGDLEQDQPNEIVVDVTHLAPKDFQPGKTILTSLAHFIRPCYCSKCDHKYQVECYLADCRCCSNPCT